MLEQVQSQIKVQSASQELAESVHDSVDQQPTSDATHNSAREPQDDWERYELRESINRICSLADKEGDEALVETQPLIDDLDRMLDAVLVTAAGERRSLGKGKRDPSHALSNVSVRLTVRLSEAW